MSDKLSPTMRHAYDWIRREGGLLERHPGGFWRLPASNEDRRHIGTSTVQALVKRDLAKYTSWKTGRNFFPIAIRLVCPVCKTDGRGKLCCSILLEKTGCEIGHGAVNDMDKEFTDYLRRCCTIKIGRSTVF